MAPQSSPRPGVREPGEGRPDPSDLLRASVSREPSGTVVTARGEIDLYSACVLREALREAIEDAVARGGVVVVDLANVTFMAASGLSVLLAALDQARAWRCELRLAGAGRAVRRPLQAAGLDPQFEHHPSVAAALQAADRARRVAQGQDGSVDGQTVSSRSSQPAG